MGGGVLDFSWVFLWVSFEVVVVVGQLVGSNLLYAVESVVELSSFRMYIPKKPVGCGLKFSFLNLVDIGRRFLQCGD